MGEFTNSCRGRDSNSDTAVKSTATTAAAPTTTASSAPSPAAQTSVPAQSNCWKNSPLRPEIPIVMRPGSRIQFGVEPERSLILPLHDSTPPGPIFSALLAAHRGENLAMAFQSAAACLPPEFVAELITDLHRANLVRKPPARRKITLIGRDSLRTGLLEALRRTGNTATTRAMSPTRNATMKLAQTTPRELGLVVVTGMEVPSLPLTRTLFHRGIEHLHTHFRDGALIIGPLVQAGRGPCAMCFEAYRRDRDPVRALIALQLRTFIPVAAPEWLRTAVPLLLGQLRKPDLSDLCGTEVRVDLENLDITRLTVTPHPQCPVCGYGNSGHEYI